MSVIIRDSRLIQFPFQQNTYHSALLAPGGLLRRMGATIIMTSNSGTLEIYV
jgi:hypothetical protein